MMVLTESLDRVVSDFSGIAQCSDALGLRGRDGILQQQGGDAHATILGVDTQAAQPAFPLVQALVSLQGDDALIGQQPTANSFS